VSQHRRRLSFGLVNDFTITRDVKGIDGSNGSVHSGGRPPE
jgi:hypothetical protein